MTSNPPKGKQLAQEDLRKRLVWAAAAVICVIVALGVSDMWRQRGKALNTLTGRAVAAGESSRPPAVNPVPPPAPVAAAPASAAPAAGYELRFPVQRSRSQAEELRALLTLHGLSGELEIQVRSGGFATLAEAEQALARLQSVGINGARVVPVSPPSP